MAVVNRSALLPYTAPEMYALITDIEAYPQFLPGCRSVVVHERREDWVRATIELARGPVHKSFTTVNRTVPDEAVEMHLEQGPFHRLEGTWRLKALGNAGCKVELHMEFEFASRVLALTIGPIFNDLVDRLVDAFHARAVSVYGRR